jgi:hypothetical protein
MCRYSAAPKQCIYLPDNLHLINLQKKYTYPLITATTHILKVLQCQLLATRKMNTSSSMKWGHHFPFQNTKYDETVISGNNGNLICNPPILYSNTVTVSQINFNQGHKLFLKEDLYHEKKLLFLCVCPVICGVPIEMFMDNFKSDSGVYITADIIIPFWLKLSTMFFNITPI